MMSTNPSRRTAPPLYSSHSLEGMEQVVPPKMMYFTPHRSEILINKPLPGRPVPIMMLDSPTEGEYSTMYSDSDSDTESTLDESLQSPSVSSSYSRERDFPIFVRSNSDDFTNFDPTPAHDMEQPVAVPSPLDLHHPEERTDASPIDISPIDIDASSIILGTSAHYGRPVDWTRRIDSNHYFREKTWDFFPELATPSTRQTSGRESPASTRTGNKGRLNVSAKTPKWYSMHSSSWKPAVRDSIKSYVNKTLTRDEAEEKDRPVSARRALPSRRFTAPMGPLSAHPPSIMGEDEDFDEELEMDEFHAQLVATSTASSSRANIFEQPRSSPLAPKDKKRGMLKRLHRATTSPEYFAHANLPPPTPPLPKVNQQPKRQTLAALQTSFDDAKKRMTETPDDRRRELLKSKIKFVGAVNPHLCAPQPDPWSP
ncbi:hypothetical protein N7504_004255 [Penicillium tannophilum]|nr:hypothetical protein N7504_004255 [Penicillium tannophilum]